MAFARLSDFTFTFHFHALEKEMATHFSVLAWRIPGTGKPGGLPSMGSYRVGHDWSDSAAAAAVSWENHSSFQGCLSNQMPASQDMFHDEQISSLHTHTHTHTHTHRLFHAKHVPWQANKLPTQTHTHTHTHTHTRVSHQALGSNLRGKPVKSQCLWVSHVQASLLLKATYWGAPLLHACFQRWGASSGVPSLSSSGVRSGFAEPQVFLKPSLCGSFSIHRAAPEITHYYNSAQSGFFPGQ